MILTRAQAVCECGWVSPICKHKYGAMTFAIHHETVNKGHVVMCRERL